MKILLAASPAVFENFKTAIFFHCGGLRLYPVTHAIPG